jgi:hypothetical protein
VIHHEVREIKPEEYSLWDDLVQQSPHGTIFHTTDWLLLISRFFKNDFKIIGCFDGEDLIGGCSLFINHVLRGHLPHASSTNAFAQYGGFVITERKTNKVRKDEQFCISIINKICDYLHALKLDMNYIEITNSPGFKDIRPFIWKGWDSEVRYTYTINLQNNIDQKISRDTRKKINACIQQTINVKKSRDANMHYNLLSKVFHRQNIEIPPKEYFEAVMDLLTKKNWGDMWIAENQSGNPIASRIVLWDKKRAYAWSAASDHDFAKTGVNSFNLYTVLQELKVNGNREIDMMQANTQRFAFFISQFNPDLVPNYKIYKKSRTFAVKLKIFNNIQAGIHKIIH